MSEVVIFADMRVEPEHAELFERRFRALVELNRAEAGNITFDVHAVDDEPGLYCVHEVWRDQAAFEEHFGLPRVQEFLRWMADDGIGETTRMVHTRRCWT